MRVCDSSRITDLHLGSMTCGAARARRLASCPYVCLGIFRWAGQQRRRLTARCLHGAACCFRITACALTGSGCLTQAWSAFREPSFGHGMLTLVDAATAQWKWNRNQDSGIAVVSDGVRLQIMHPTKLP